MRPTPVHSLYVIFPLISALLFAPSAARADPERDVRFAMRGNLLWDVGYLLAADTALVLGVFVLSPPHVNVAPLDGLGHRPESRWIGTASDYVALGGMLGADLLGLATELGRGAQGLDLARAPLILTESALMAEAVVSVTKNVVGECRPRAWDDATGHCDTTSDESRLAFPSGHTAPLAAMAGASWGMYLFPTRHRSEYLPLVFVTTGLAITNMVLRVQAGAHSWVDTGTGLALGTGIGLATAYLHMGDAPGFHIWFTRASGSVQVSGAF